MGFFNKKKNLKIKNEKMGKQLNELKEEDLLNIAGGQEYHNEGGELNAQQNVMQIVNNGM